MAAEQHLRALGFTQHEAAVYVYLLRHPLQTGYEVAKGSGLPRGNVYQVLEALARHDAVQAISDEPVRYVAVPPAQLIDRTRRIQAGRCEAALDALTAVETPPEVGLFYNLRGAETVIERVVAMLNRASGRAVLSLWSEDLPALEHALRAAHARGTTLVLNVFGEGREGVPAGAQVYWHEPGDKTVGGHLVIAAVDNREALAATLDAPASGVYTENGTLVRLVEKLVRDESYLAEIFAHFGPDLEARFGRHLVDLRRRLLPRDQAERLLTIVAFGKDGPTVSGGSAARALLDAGLFAPRPAARV